MLNARRRPQPNIGPTFSKLIQSSNNLHTIIFNSSSSTLIASCNTEGRVLIGKAFRVYYVPDRVLVVRRLNDQHRNFEIPCQVDVVIALDRIIFELFNAIRKRERNCTLVVDQLQQILGSYADD